MDESGLVDGWVLPEELLRDAPAFAPSPREFADLELILSGALAPLGGFQTRAEQAGPVPVTLEIPASIAGRLDLTDPLRRLVVLTDLESAPVAALDVTDLWPTREGWFGAGGRVRRIGEETRGSFRRLRQTPAEVRASLPPGRVLGVYVDAPLHRPQLAQISYAARTIGGSVLLLIPGLSPEQLVRAVLAARDRLPNATMVTVPVAKRGDDIADALLRGRVAENYGATHLLASELSLTGGGLRALLPRELAYDGRDGQWRAADDIPPRHQRAALTEEQLARLLDRGIPLPEWHTPPAVAHELAKAHPPRRVRGVVVFFTGLSGSGKSTIARGVAAELAETGERTVTLIDGDVARRFLTAGLNYSKADRDENVRRIGFVAAEAARHGGLVLCCPVAPYAGARDTARQLARAAGAGFILVYAATPLEVCEARDRKGFYAKARAGMITNFTGIDDPYEVPTDADVVIDTSERSVEQNVGVVLDYLTVEGWLDRP